MGTRCRIFSWNKSGKSFDIAKLLGLLLVRKDDEVDFILERRGKIIAVEVKSNDSENSKGLEVFKNKFNPDKLYLITNRGLSWQEFLKINPIDLF